MSRLTRIHFVVFLKLVFVCAHILKFALVQNQNFYILKNELQQICIETLFLLSLALSFASSKLQDSLLPPLNSVCLLYQYISLYLIFQSVFFKMSEDLGEPQYVCIEQLKFTCQRTQSKYPL